MSFNVAVVGATGNVGREIISILAERKFAIKNIYALASKESLGTRISFGLKVLEVKALEGFDFTDIDIAILAAGSGVSEVYAEKIAKQGAIVVDNASFHRMDEEIPLVVTEVNGEEVKNAKKGIICVPNCIAVPLSVVLSPLHQKYKVNRVVSSTYQAVSGKGKNAMDELYLQTKRMYEANNLAPKEFVKQIAFNCLPQIGSFDEETGETGEETKIKQEVKKILNHPNLSIEVTSVRVPVFNCHSQAVNIQLENEFEIDDIYDLFSEHPEIMLYDRREDGGFKTPVEATKTDFVYISRIRRDESLPNGLSLWIVSDNLRKGAALDTVLICEEIAKQGLI